MLLSLQKASVYRRTSSFSDTGKSSFDLRAQLIHTIGTNIPFRKLFTIPFVVFRSTAGLVTCLDSKIPSRKTFSLERSTAIRVVTARLIIKEKRSNIFLLKCLGTWELNEKMGNLTIKRIKNAKKSAISDHLLQCDSPIALDDFDILASDSNKCKLLIKEILPIKRGKSVLNRKTKSFPLDLFEWVNVYFL